MTIPKKLLPRWSYRAKIRGEKKLWVRVNIHENEKKFRDYLRRMVPSYADDAMAICSAPAYRDKKATGCVMEINFFYPRIGPTIAAHEFLHATLNVLSLKNIRNVIPDRELVATRKWRWGFKTKRAAENHARKWNEADKNNEYACEVLESFMGQFHDECVKRKLWNK